MNIEKIIYYLTPPLFWKLYQKFKPTRKLYNQQHFNSGTMIEELKKLKNKGFNYFFNKEVIEAFCDSMELDLKISQPIDPKIESNNQYLDELTRNGFCKITNLIKKESVKIIHDQIMEIIKPLEQRVDDLISEHGIDSGQNIQEKHQGLQVNFELNNGVIRLWDLQKLYKIINSEFLNNPVIIDVCKSYLGGNINDSRVYAEYKFKKHLLDPNLRAHCDSPFRMLKVFLLLNDIELENAPFIYYKKSHNFNQWRILKDLLEFSQVNKQFFSAYGNYGDLELSKIVRNFPEMISKKEILTGKAGDVIITDNRGIHQGSILKKGYRLQLGLGFSPLANTNIEETPLHVKRNSSFV